jgi:hypothetical protein
MVNAHPAGLHYKLHAHSPNKPRVTVAKPTWPGVIRGVNLDLSRYRMDSARVLGMKLLKDAVLDAIKHQQLNGGPTWAAERLIGRIRYLVERHNVAAKLTDSFDSLEGLFTPRAHAWVDDGAFFGRERFSIRSLLDDIATLRLAGKTALDPWWLRLGWNETATLQDEDVVRRVLDEDFRRMQIVYAEVIQYTFSSVAEEMDFFTDLPIRGKFYVVQRDQAAGGSTVYYQWLTASSWDEIGADVATVDRDDAQKALTGLSDRNADVYRAGFTPLPDFSGRHWNGRFDGATTVMHEVCSLLTDDIESLFKALPASDGEN